MRYLREICARVCERCLNSPHTGDGEANHVCNPHPVHRGPNDRPVGRLLGRSLSKAVDQRLKLWGQGLIAQSVIHRPKPLPEMISIRAAKTGLRLGADWPEWDLHDGPWCFGG